jgi:hypothetical protein
VIALQSKIRDNAGNPKNFYSFISSTDGYSVTNKIFADIKNKI